LPAECPLEHKTDREQVAWRELVTAHTAYRDSGAVNPWAFARLVRQFHRVCSEQERDDLFLLKWSLAFGPWRSVLRDEGVTPAREPSFTDDELADAWKWAQHEPPPWRTGEWDETTWAYRRYVLGEDAVTAFRECRRRDREERTAC
jgi:hypothetical protein